MQCAKCRCFRGHSLVAIWRHKSDLIIIRWPSLQYHSLKNCLRICHFSTGKTKKLFILLIQMRHFILKEHCDVWRKKPKQKNDLLTDFWWYIFTFVSTVVLLDFLDTKISHLPKKCYLTTHYLPNELLMKLVYFFRH